MTRPVNPNDFVITRKRKKYKFAHFANQKNCFEIASWIPPAQGPSLCIELGAGDGHFAVELAQRHPEVRYVAVDVKADRLQSGARLAQELGLINIQFVRAHADEFLDICPPNSVSQIWLTFSDPFPKKRHAKHRLSHPHFLMKYRGLLVHGGELFLKTDDTGLFDWSLEQLKSSGWYVRDLSYNLQDSELPDDYKIMTTYEKKWTAQGLNICFVGSTL